MLVVLCQVINVCTFSGEIENVQIILLSKMMLSNFQNVRQKKCVDLKKMNHTSSLEHF